MTRLCCSASPPLPGEPSGRLHSRSSCAQTLAYLLPALSLAVQRAELEYNTLQARGRPQDAGALQVILLILQVGASHSCFMRIFLPACTRP